MVFHSDGKVSFYSKETWPWMWDISEYVIFVGVFPVGIKRDEIY